MLAAYTIGGDYWLTNQVNNYKKLLTSRHTGEILNKYLTNLNTIKDEVIFKGKQDMQWINKHSKTTLTQLMSARNWQ